MKVLIAILFLISSALALPLPFPTSETQPEGYHTKPAITSRAGTPSEDITYILPIWEGALAQHDPARDLSILNTMRDALGTGGPHTKLGWSFSSWALSRDIGDTDMDYTFDPTNLKYMLALALQAGLPVLVHMNNGRWADCCTSNSDGGWKDNLLDLIASNPNTTMMNSAGESQYAHDYGSNYFSLSRLNTVYRKYKQRNTVASARTIAEWAKSNPSSFAGVSLSSEPMYPAPDVDFNPKAIEEWTMWMSNTGIYGPGGEFFGEGRVPRIQDIHTFNGITKQSFPSWATVRPPNRVTPGDRFGEEWQRWRVQMIINHVADETGWIASAGIDRSLIFGHMTPRLDDYGLSDTIETATAANGAGGATFYGWNPMYFGEVTNAYRGTGRTNWGVFETNPLSSDAMTNYNTLLTFYKDGAKVICPNSWEGDMAVKDEYAIFDSPYYGNTYGDAIRKFLIDYASVPRNLEPPAYNPGRRLFDLYDLFKSAETTGIDNHLEPSGSVGKVVRKSIFSHVDGSLTYNVNLPVVTDGQRLNFWTSVGIKDGAGAGGPVEFQATINGGPKLFGRSFRLLQSNWVWNHWTPIMVDITDWSGQSISLTLTTRGNDQYGWTMWGSPAIYLASRETASISGAVNDMAFGALTTASSEDVGYGSRAASITDGSETGWSSIFHASEIGLEWVMVDLKSSRRIGKVVLFAREDLVPYTGTGFPTAFEIQASENSAGEWKTLIKVSDYPRPRAGDGQIFTFESINARFIRVVATTLGGVGMETGYRFQLAEMQVYE
ncbi:hypothetical protein BJ878DRAFT_479336 [Calycina marina]|uniref:F5/8 type C domain-containing protein n=1 Tax=Calycina marina TaxID=1763456 RepID=A0A9P8CFM7_9HELO|nr:hypothetical protein BJ878DRAFT_479336 [Calycina marina]